MTVCACLNLAFVSSLFCESNLVGAFGGAALCSRNAISLRDRYSPFDLKDSRSRNLRLSMSDRPLESFRHSVCVSQSFL